jgi:PAS domain S-box-containing protein
VGRLGFDLCRPEHLPLAQEGFARCLAHPGNPIEFTIDVGHRAGGYRTLAVKLVNRIPAPRVRAVVVQFRDVARDLPVPYQALFEQAAVGLGVADLEGNLLAFNDAILKPGGYTRLEMLQIGNVGLLYSSPAEREPVLGIAREQGFVWREQVQFRRKDGSCYDTLLTLTPVQVDGRPCW